MIENSRVRIFSFGISSFNLSKRLQHLLMRTSLMLLLDNQTDHSNRQYNPEIYSCWFGLLLRLLEGECDLKAFLSRYIT